MSKMAINDMTLNAIRSGKPDDASSTRNDAVADNILQHMETATKAMPTKEDLAAAVDHSKPRPMPNMSAEYPGDVYPIETVVGSELMTILDVKDWVDASASGQGVDVSSRFVARRIVKLARNKQIQKLKVLRFILLAINFGASLKAGGKGAKKIPPKGKLEEIMGANVPVECVMALRRKFAKEGYGFTNFLLPRD
jgi:DNA-directed RNA polymerase I subunit RPA49